jgi:hypothetical protein
LALLREFAFGHLLYFVATCSFFHKIFNLPGVESS